MAPPVPRATEYEAKLGDDGWLVWAVQRSMNRLGNSLAEDWHFGPETDVVVRRYQRNRGLVVDGVVGRGTQIRIDAGWATRAEDAHPDLVIGALKGISAGESSDRLGAVHVNPSTPDRSESIDLSSLQRNVPAPYTRDEVERAYDVKLQFDLAARFLIGRHTKYVGAAAVDSDERAWRLALLSWNYQTGADRLASTREKDLSPYWTTEQDWVLSNRAHFADGTAVRTPLEHCKFYALGAPEHRHEGLVARAVDWASVPG